ncbi:PDZ domain-containing protein MAGIX isoform X2 [Echinops telfairi]|uniref:PDZ domain-containing protein MAGIX isoform X2 n=1 Tax=Echinops telfairi TaxID=9371 RepID=A0AC55CXM4_ECHTE|nr:PDZ domain-containing protein MAGIX isoform X2 [Echinops telfairi]
MEARSRGAVDPRGSTGGRSLPPRAGPSAPQFLARLDARPLAARAAADVAALVRRAGATLRLRPKEGACELDPADIEFTDSHLPHASVVGHRHKAGDLVLHINGESTNGLTKAQVMERIRSVGPRLHLVLCRPLDTQKRDLRLDPGRPEVTRSCSAGGSPRQHPESGTMTQICGSLESSSEAAVHRAGGSPTERPMEDPGNHSPSSPGPWLVPCEERLSQALRVPAGKQLALAMATGRRRH